MQFLLQFEVFPTITRPEDIQRVRDEVGAHLQTLQKSGKVKAGGVLVGKRGGVLIVEAKNNEELFDLIGSPFVDNGTLQVTPLVSFDKLGEYFAKLKAPKAGK